jgi:hypothetical protein
MGMRIGTGGKTRRVATLVAVLVALTAIAGATASAAGAFSLVFNNWAVYGSLTPKKLNEPVVLPKGSTFNGSAEVTKLSSTEIEGTLSGKLFVPPFKATVKLVGTVPTTVGVTIKEEGTTEGTISTAPDAACSFSRFTGICVALSVTSHARIGITAAGILGIEVPTGCETEKAVTLTLNKDERLSELSETHVTGTTTIPPIKCEGLQGIVLGVLLTELMSGPGNPYALSLSPNEPTAPLILNQHSFTVSQISAKLRAEVEPRGEPVTSCHFEYGTTNKYGTTVPCTLVKGAAGFSETAQLAGLAENTTYHWRTVATNSVGTSMGEDQEFTTLGAAGSPEYGVCSPQKKGEYENSSCGNKSAKPHKGVFEWKPGPAPSCVPQKKGNYTDAGCTTKSAKPKKGTFEKAPGPAFTSSGGAATISATELGGSGGTTITCTASSGAGEVTGVKSGVERITFSGCESAGKQCTSEGANSTPSGTPGVIVTNLLAMRPLGPIAPLNSVWTELSSAQHQPYLLEANCEGRLLRTKGSVSGVQEGNVSESSATSTTKFLAESVIPEGEQALLSELSENGGSSWAGPAAASLVTTVTNTAASTTEVRR